MTDLMRSEVRRLFARRVTWIGMALCLVGVALTLWASAQMSMPMTATEQAEMQAMYEQQVKDWEQNKEMMCPGLEPECVASSKPSPDWYVRTVPHLNDVMRSSTNGAAYIGFLGALVIGASMISAEFSTGSISTLLSFVPNRNRVYVAKGTVLVGAGAALGAATIGLAMAGTAGFYALFNGAAKTIGAEQSTLTALRGVTVVAAGALLGYSLAMLLRYTGAVIGVVLGYTFFAGAFNSLAIYALKIPQALAWLPDNNLYAWLHGSWSTGWIEDGGPGKESIERTLEVSWQQGGLYWLVLLAVLTVLGWWVFRKRDVA